MLSSYAAFGLVFILALLAAATLYSETAAKRFERAAPPAGAFASVEGGRIHYKAMGEGGGALPPVVLIHGASANLRDMEIALGQRLAENRRVLIVDRPGHGYSSRDAEGWRIDRQAAMIREAVASQGLKAPIIVGQSFGGAVALSYALQFQDEMAGLALLAPVSHEWPGGVAWYNTVSGAPVFGVLLRRAVLPFYGPYVARDGFPDAFAPNTPPEDYAARAGATLLFRPHAFRNNAEDLRRLKPQIIRQQHEYGQLKLPVAIAAGTDDTAVSPVLHAQALARQIPGARLEMLADTGHALHHARAERIIQMIDALSAGLEAGG